MLLAVLVGGVVAVVVIALIIVFARGGPVEFDADTPEGVVQRYSQAVIDGDVDAAMEYLVPEVAESCRRPPASADKLRVTLLSTDEHDETARVKVSVAAIYGSGPLGTSEYEYDAIFELERVDGDWAVATTPFELAVCLETAEGP